VSAASRWAENLAAWAIPDEILAQAPQSPWIHPVQQFVVPDVIDDSPSHARAREAVPAGGSVLDVGCGGGRAAFAVTPPASLVIGVDHQQGMLDAFAAEAVRRGADHRTHLGDWPDVAGGVDTADVVVCHHVAYNVADLVPFVRALDEHATRRVVMEIPTQHPLSNLSPLWRRFWNLDRPEGPTATDAVDVCREAGLTVNLEVWEGPSRLAVEIPFEDQVRFTRIRLCLPEERDPEVADGLRAMEPQPPRQLATLWWDIEAA
jgi:SAM-dependent methyltransferase